MACPGSPSSSVVKPGTDPQGGGWLGPVPLRGTRYAVTDCAQSPREAERRDGATVQMTVRASTVAATSRSACTLLNHFTATWK